ncbi:MAG: hypothetical protein AAFY60_11645, partial [Myxococcota bacterium]
MGSELSLFAPESSSPARSEEEIIRAQVVVSEPLNVLDYRVPEALKYTLAVGVPVKVPLGKRKTRGYVAALVTGPAPDGIRLKDVAEVDAERPKVP